MPANRRRADLIGNITMKSDVCPSPPTPCYSYHATRKHAVTTAGGNTYAYDANGNVTNKNGAAVEWTSYSLPKEINGSGVVSYFSYGPNRHRFMQVANYVGGLETTRECPCPETRGLLLLAP